MAKGVNYRRSSRATGYRWNKGTSLREVGWRPKSTFSGATKLLSRWLTNAKGVPALHGHKKEAILFERIYWSTIYIRSFAGKDVSVPNNKSENAPQGVSCFLFGNSPQKNHPWRWAIRAIVYQRTFSLIRPHDACRLINARTSHAVVN